MPDIVYVLTNPTLHGSVKIGRTTTIKTRMRTLNTGVPTPFAGAMQKSAKRNRPRAS